MPFLRTGAILIKIISTSHLNDGGDIVGQIIQVNCRNESHNHPIVGDYINFRADEIKTYRIVTKR